MDTAKIRLIEFWRAAAGQERCWRMALRALVTPLVVSLFFPLYVLGAVSVSQLRLQKALDEAPASVLRALEPKGAQVISDDRLGLPEVPITLRYLEANGRVVVLLNAERRFVVKAPFLPHTEFQVAAASRRRLH
ncbi:MAG: hypothetical protein EP347_09185 [Alphaproteobacteria bacterium]|nr:MAG: hypothetical protein EP347_09185 [Alphaproteobacteria bacterium]